VARVNAKGPQEAANSQALSTRQSIAVPALSLANQSQQSVPQLLRSEATIKAAGDTRRFSFW
jgi:hypothetical protein